MSSVLRGWRRRKTCSSSAISWSTVSDTGLSTIDEATVKTSARLPEYGRGMY